MSEIIDIIDNLIKLDDSEKAVLCTLVDVKGSSYRRPGARLLIINDCLKVGSISGGCLEEDLFERAKHVAITGISEIVVYDTTEENDLLWGVGLGCHGVVTVLIELINHNSLWYKYLNTNLKKRHPSEIACYYKHETSSKLLLGTYLRSELDSKALNSCFIQTIAPPHQLVIFGAGDDVIPLYSLALQLGWVVTIADPRPTYATKARFPRAATVIGGSIQNLIDQSLLNQETLCVIMTHHYIHDLPLLKGAIQASCRYIGLLGPKKRADKILSDLVSEGLMISSTTRDQLHAPVGLNLGGDTPQSVALSIVSEIQAFLTKQDARPLKDRNKPIHG